MLYSIKDTTMETFADTIREKNGTTAKMTPAEMISAISALPSADETMPSGGTTGQILRKASDADYDVAWQSVDADPTTASTNLVQSGGVAAALAGKVNTADYNPVAATADMTIPVGKDASGKLFALASTGAQQYIHLRRIVLGYSLLTSKPADWETDFTNYFENTGTDNLPVYTTLSGETAPEWEATKYYSKSDSAIASISALNLSAAVPSVLVSIIAPSHTGNSNVNISIATDTSSQYKYVIASVSIQAAATSARTSYAYFIAGDVLPFAITQIGTSAPSIVAGRVGKGYSASDVQSETYSTIKRITFSITNGLPSGTSLEIWGCVPN